MTTSAVRRLKGQPERWRRAVDRDAASSVEPVELDPLAANIQQVMAKIRAMFQPPASQTLGDTISRYLTMSPGAVPAIDPAKYVAVVATTSEVLEENPFSWQGAGPTPEQRVRAAAERQATSDQHAALLAGTDGALRAVVELHALDDNMDCAGCDYSGWESEPPLWPCRTITLIAEQLGITIEGGDRG